MTSPNLGKFLVTLPGVRWIWIERSTLYQCGIVILAVFAIALYAIITIRDILNFTVFESDGEDIRNWAALIIEAGIGTVIALIIVIYDKKQQKRIRVLEETRTKSEHQHYKERLTYEFPIFLDRVNAMADTLSLGQSSTAQSNMFHAKTNLESLRSINSIFDIPAEIRSEFDDILGDYAATLENVEHGCMRTSDIHIINADYAKKARSFFSNDFFKEKNTDKINIRLNGINQSLNTIVSKNTKTNS